MLKAMLTGWLAGGPVYISLVLDNICVNYYIVSLETAVGHASLTMTSSSRLCLFVMHPSAYVDSLRVDCSRSVCLLWQFLQRVSIACYAERCINCSKSVRLSVRPSHAGTESKRLKLRSWDLHWRIAPWL